MVKNYDVLIRRDPLQSLKIMRLTFLGGSVNLNAHSQLETSTDKERR